MPVVDVLRPCATTSTGVAPARAARRPRRRRGRGGRRYAERAAAAATPGATRIPGKHGARSAPTVVVPVAVPDEPGQLGRLFAAVADAGFTVEDVRIEHVLGRPTGVVEMSVDRRGRGSALGGAARRRLGRARLTARAPRGGLIGPAPVVEVRPLGWGAVETKHAVVAIDGPSGSGKSSTSRGVARALGLSYLDTGAMYRAMAWYMLEQGVDVDDPEAVAARAADPQLLSIGTDPDAPAILVDGVDVSGPIRGEEVTAAVSRGGGRACGARPAGRAAAPGSWPRSPMTERGIVVEGRDIGGVVLPDATAKIYLTADAEARAARRALEDAERAGEASAADVAATAASLAARDEIDSSRGGLAAAPG